MKVLNTKNITKVYGGKEDAGSTRALDGVDLSVEAGEFVGVMGPSGSGKSTLLNILSGIDIPTTGNIEIDGRSITTMSKDELALFRRQKLGFVFQEFNLLDSLTLKENVMLPLILDKKDSAYMEEKIKEIMSLFEIYHIKDKYPHGVSGGQQQRAAVSRSLVSDPAIVFADEPTGNLDSKSSNAVMRLFTKMNTERNSTILMVTHDAFAASFCKRIIFIKDGKVCMEIVSKGDRKEFFDRILDCLAVIGGEKNEI
ncbi:MAG: multidrug ABC transporter ATP-binding protein [Clostridiales bacterium 43-6]|nr:MAG: multidrug ABC transporter ATP-binding protein [Clostridiales bacterium 43-6]